MADAEIGSCPKCLYIPLDLLSMLDVLEGEQFKRVVLACAEYVQTGQEPQCFSPVEKAVFEGLRPTNDFNIKKYRETVERNRKNGQLGGRPRKPSGFFGNPLGANKNENKNLNENEKSSILTTAPTDDLTTTTLEESFKRQIGYLSDLGKGELSGYVQRLSAELVGEIINKCADLGGHSWAYVRKALAEAEAQGCRSVEEYRKTNPIGGSRANGKRVDHPEPSGNDFLKNAAHRRPLTKKAKEEAPDGTQQ